MPSTDAPDFLSATDFPGGPSHGRHTGGIGNAGVAASSPAPRRPAKPTVKLKTGRPAFGAISHSRHDFCSIRAGNTPKGTNCTESATSENPGALAGAEDATGQPRGMTVARVKSS